MLYEVITYLAWAVSGAESFGKLILLGLLVGGVAAAIALGLMRPMVGGQREELLFLEGLLRGQRQLTDRLPEQADRPLAAAINQWLEALSEVFEGVSGNLVITSYSIHYTKLYDGGVSARAARPDLQRPRCRGHSGRAPWRRRVRL